MRLGPAVAVWSMVACGELRDGAIPAPADADRDGTEASADCDDRDPESTIRSEDADCDGVLTEDDCDDEDASVGRCVSPDSGDSGTSGDSGDSGDTALPNNPPTTPTVALSPSSPRTTDDLVCSVGMPSTDPDGDAVSYTFVWTSGAGGPHMGTVAADGLSSTLPSSSTSKGEEWKCSVMATDGVASSASAMGSVTVEDSPPTVPTSVNVDPGAPMEGEALTCVASGGVDPDGETVTYGWRWTRDGQPVASLSGASSVPAHTTKVGASWSCGARSVAGGEVSGFVDSADVLVTADPTLPTPGNASHHPVLGTLRFVPRGSFTMGCVAPRDVASGLTSCSRGDELPSRQVTLTTAVWVMESELTQEMWAALGFTTDPSFFSGTTRPVDTVTWWESLEAANEASRREGRAVCYALTGCSGVLGSGRACSGVTLTSPSGHPKDCAGWRLPTGAEWEYTARAGGSLPYSGSADVGEVAWYIGTNGPSGTPTYGTKAVCTTPTPRNAWGLCDLSGNVYEWTWDWYASSYRGLASTDPVGPASGSYREVRGGSWGGVAQRVRVATRNNNSPGNRNYFLGFRLVRSVP